AQIAADVASVASALCPGADIRAGYDSDGPASLRSVLTSVAAERARAEADTAGCPYAAVTVPLAITPEPGRDGAVARAVAEAGPAVTRTAHLGPHPLLAAALHDRLAEAGLVPARRIAGLSLVRTELGILIGAAGGGQALAAAETAAVLLTARLGVPVAPVSLDGGDSLAGGVTRLREAGASRFALAPYVVGPEVGTADLAAMAAAAGADCAPLLGSHHAIGRLVTMRYGAALAG
ncbi:MAG TPA: hypothetical protein VGI31_00675, partial [Streptosporangiaceae bacterium]